MSQIWLLVLAALAGLALGAGLGILNRRRQAQGRRSAGDPACELDRLENILRRDPYRDDIKALYVDLVSRAGPEERERRRTFLEGLGESD
jgi:hypothetical protein